MDGDSFGARMRELEYFHSLRILPGLWSIVRVDGRGFTRWIGERFERPFDLRIRDCMTATAEALLKEMQGIYAYTESDEISVLFAPEWDLFRREVEKTVSVSAGIASAAFTQAAGEAAHFDSRIWVGVDEATVIDYFRWRQSDAARCALNGWCYWTLRKEGMSPAAATHELEGRSAGFKNELLFQRGINFDALPAWQRRGIGLYWADVPKQGFNPKLGAVVETTRRQIALETDLPMKEAYAEHLARLLARARGAT